MSRYHREPSTVTVTVLNLESAEAAALDYLRKHAQVDAELGSDVKIPTAVRADERWAIVDTPQGLYALCGEGVGPDRPITDEQPLTVSFYVTAYEGKGDGFISLAPACETKLGPDDLRERATGEQKPLHEFIRSFGARLESNYSAWRRTLEAAHD